MSGRSWARPNVQSGSFASVVGPSALVRSTTECCPASARIKLARWAKSRLFVHDASRAAFDPKSVARPEPSPARGRGSLPGAIGALRSELLLEEVAHRSPRALVGL